MVSQPHPAKSRVKMEGSKGIMGKPTCPLFNQLKKNPWNKDQDLRKMIGLAKHQNRLCYFETSSEENSIKEDKDQDSYLISPVLTNPPTVSGPVFDPVSVPHFYEPESSLLKLTHGNQMTSKVT
ncbi:hypothetical protein CK203_090507 [Vitis vinifera]|uniref:Uncharacterized protein n=1 Tax=Vitis vinifera TaxID=29760 RepID=A0A438BTX2_VITVI|nr:hypothetical protein CK203_090507 [Vitis vinifera]